MAFSRFKSSSEEDSQNQRDDLVEINMIPLIDVMLVLLIVFMVAAPLSISGISVQLPSTKGGGSAISENKIVLTITAKGEYFIDKLPIPKDSFEQKIKTIYATREDKSLYIRADKNVPYGTVVSAMGSAKTCGVKKIAMLTTPVVANNK